MQGNISVFDQPKITHPELRFCFDLALIMHFPGKRNLLAFRV